MNTLEDIPARALVSIIIRSMGRLSLRQAMDSVLQQTYPYLELVVVNAKGAGHPHLQKTYGCIPLHLVTGEGVETPIRRSIAANLGMAHAHGRYCLFLDDDDWLLPSHISALVEALVQQTHLRVAYAGVECVREETDGTFNNVLYYNDPFDATRLLYENYLPIHAVLFERALFSDGFHFDETLDIYEDWDFWLQLRQAGPFAHVDQISAVYRINNAHHQGATAQKGLVINAWAAVIRKWFCYWSDAERQEICRLAKEGHVYYQEVQKMRVECDALKTDLLLERQYREAITVLLYQKQQELLSQSPLSESGERQLQAQRAVITLQSRIEMLSEQILWQRKALNRLSAIEASRIWRASYPYRWLRITVRQQWQRFFSKRLPQTPDVPDIPNGHLIDIIIPVYRGFDQTRACLESVLATAPIAPAQIIVINDASPEDVLVDWLNTLASQHPHLIVLHNQENRGFVHTCNRGMALHTDRDVVLLNSDTVVAGDWLVRLQRCAYRAQQIGTVTPFSNNATICSYPRFCADNLFSPTGMSAVAERDALFAECNSDQWVEIPTAVGFCMYIRRDCLNETGPLDEYHFGKGYGEENDFCMRATALGWRHALSADVFVYHEGSVSFADHYNEKKQRALEVLNRLHPHYDGLVQAHLLKDPAKLLRTQVDLARLQKSTHPIILFITHNQGGGTQKHVEELAARLSSTAHVLLLRPGNPAHHHVLSWLHPDEALELFFHLPTDINALEECLTALNVQRIHIHHLWGVHPAVLTLSERLGVPYDVTIHDYYLCCPQITLTNYQGLYCGEPSAHTCNRCLIVNPAHGARDITRWREQHRHFLAQAAQVFAPSQDTAQRLSRYFPERPILYAPHRDLENQRCPSPQPIARNDDVPLRIVVIGALSAVKGADVLEACVLDAQARRLPITFTLIGYAYRDLHRHSSQGFTVHGAYTDAELPKLLATAQPDVVWFPAQWPETYSYTLSACLQAGLPVVVPDLGAFPERVAGRPWSWACPWQQSATAWNDFFVDIRVRHFITGVAPLLSAESIAPMPMVAIEKARVQGIRPPRMDESEITLVLKQIAKEFSTPRLSDSAKRQAAIKQQLLVLARRVRRLPILRGVVQRIPLRWQWRVWSWLRGNQA